MHCKTVISSIVWCHHFFRNIYFIVQCICLLLIRLSLLPAECPAKFDGATYCWTFESVNDLKQTFESNKKKIGTLSEVQDISTSSVLLVKGFTSLVQIWQNTKPIALLFGQNWPILATFHSTMQIRKNDF